MSVHFWQLSAPQDGQKAAKTCQSSSISYCAKRKLHRQWPYGGVYSRGEHVADAAIRLSTR